MRHALVLVVLISMSASAATGLSFTDDFEQTGTDFTTVWTNFVAAQTAVIDKRPAVGTNGTAGLYVQFSGSTSEATAYAYRTFPATVQMVMDFDVNVDAAIAAPTMPADLGVTIAALDGANQQRNLAISIEKGATGVELRAVNRLGDAASWAVPDGWSRVRVTMGAAAIFVSVNGSPKQVGTAAPESSEVVKLGISGARVSIPNGFQTELDNFSLAPLSTNSNDGFVGLTVTPRFEATVPACKTISVIVEAKDSQGARLPGERPVQVCATEGADVVALFTNMTHSNTSHSNTCVTGNLLADGSAEVKFKSRQVDSAKITATTPEGTQGTGDVLLTWTAAIFDASFSKFVFEATPALQVAPLAPGGDPIDVVFVPKDSCNATTTFSAAEELSLAGEAPLHVTPFVKEETGYRASISLLSCPADPTQPLALQAMLSGASMEPHRFLKVAPVCGDVSGPHLTTVTVAFEGAPATASAGYALTAKVSVQNDSATELTDAEVRFPSQDGLAITGVSLNGVPLVASAEGYALPTIGAGERVELVVDAHVTMEQSGTARLSARIHRTTGAAISDAVAAEVPVTEHVVDVGGCSAEGGSGSLAALMLIAASVMFMTRRREARSRRDSTAVRPRA